MTVRFFPFSLAVVGEERYFSWFRSLFLPASLFLFASFVEILRFAFVGGSSSAGKSFSVVGGWLGRGFYHPVWYTREATADDDDVAGKNVLL